MDHTKLHTVSYGKIRLTENAYFENKTTFNLNTDSIISNIRVSVALTHTAVNYPSQRGWLFNAINEIEIELGNVMNTISGELFKEMALLTCVDRNQRNNLLKCAGDVVEDTNTTASIPLYFYVQKMAGSMDGIIMSAFQNKLKVSITWNKNYNFIGCENGGAFNPPSSFDRCDLVVNTYEKLMKIDKVLPEPYVLNSMFVHESKYNCTLSKTDYTPLFLTNPPKGPLYGIILKVRPTDSYGAKDGLSEINGCGEDLSGLRLDCGGMSIFDCQSYAEINSTYLFQFGDILDYDNYMEVPSPGAGYNYDNYLIQNGSKSSYARRFNEKVYIIPFVSNPKQIFSSDLVENVPEYSNAPFVLYLKLRDKEYVNSVAFNPALYSITTEDPYVPGATINLDAAGPTNLIQDGISYRTAKTSVNVYVGYIVRNYINVSGGVAQMF